MAQNLNTSLIVNGLTSDTKVFVVKTGTTDLFNITAGGNIGIGTDSPTAKFHNIGTNSTEFTYNYKFHNSTGSRFMQMDNDGTIEAVGRLNITWANNVDFSALRVSAQTGQIFNIQGGGSGTVCVGTGVADSDSKLHIKGVDTTSLNYALKVTNSASTSLFNIRNDGHINMSDGNVAVTTAATINVIGSGSGFFSPSVSLWTLSGNTGIIDYGADGLFIRYAADTKLYIGSSGFLGVGNISPSDTLSIYDTKTATSTPTPDSINLGGTYSNAAGDNLKFKIYDDGTSIGGFGVSSGRMDYKSWGTGADHVFYAGTGNTLMTIKGTGEVGIGISAPAEKIHISNGTIRINDTGSTYGAGKIAVSDINGSISFSSTTALGISSSYATTLTTPGANVTNTITHNLGTTDIAVALWLVTTGDLTNARVTNRTANTVDVIFSSAPGENVRVVIK